jgi:hypothetical protein
MGEDLKRTIEVPDPMDFAYKPMVFFFMPVYSGAPDVRRLFIIST